MCVHGFDVGPELEMFFICRWVAGVDLQMRRGEMAAVQCLARFTRQ